MNVIISSKNAHVGDYLKETIEKKLEKLGKYFSDDIVANVLLEEEKKSKKIETTIRTKGMIFRAEATADEFYDAIDKIVDRLSTQMSRFKNKIQRKHKDIRDYVFEEWPTQEEATEIQVKKKKKFDLEPMSVDEAIVQMELLEHSFFVFLNMETDSVNVVYKRNAKDYGLLETTY